MSKTKFVAYLRKSTKNKASQMKHSLDTQLNTIQSFASQIDGQLVQVFKESHSGMDENRPQLEAALDYCKEHNATLIVATLCRLSRSINQVNNLFHSPTKIVVCEYGMSVSIETILLMSVLNQLEVQRMSTRIKKGMATAKLKGQTFGKGGHKFIHKAQKASCEKARMDREQMFPLIHGLRVQGRPWRDIANHLNRLGISTPRGKKWSLQTARNLYMRGKHEATGTMEL
tara:strand:- start:1876 stop:2562 length:687 start_codon:yes stop_codon:yes gene_type:complete